ncbi:hypothetical protein M758_6G102400 [Ceratodon purpureus]|nr:hypothetical protein M758_6G102400 [Ceratodon purpureus]
MEARSAHHCSDGDGGDESNGVARQGPRWGSQLGFVGSQTHHPTTCCETQTKSYHHHHNSTVVVATTIVKLSILAPRSEESPSPEHVPFAINAHLSRSDRENHSFCRTLY